MGEGRRRGGKRKKGREKEREIERREKEKEKRAGRRDQTEQTDRAQLCVPGSRTSRLLLNGGSLPTKEREKEERPTASLPANVFFALHNESRSRSRSLVAMAREELEAAG